MEKFKFADVLNLEEQKRKEIILNGTRINSSDSMNYYERTQILKTLNEESRIEILKNSYLSEVDNFNIIMTLSEKIRFQMLFEPNIELYSGQKKDIILSLNEELRYKIFTDNTVNLYDSDRESIGLSLSEEHRKSLSESKDAEEKNESYDEEQIEVDSSFPERTISKLNEVSRIKLIEKHFETMDIFAKMTLIGNLSEEYKMYFLENYKFDAMTRSQILRGISEQSKVLMLEKSDNIANNTSKILNFTEETRKKILREGKIKCESKKILLSCSGETRREFLDSDIVKLNTQDKLEIIFSLDEYHREQYMKGLNEEEKSILKSIDSVIKARNHPDEVVADIDAKTLGLPENMTIGVELEAEGKNANLVKSLGCILPNWRTENDGSLQEGVEVVSPILHDNINDMKELEAVCNAMQQAQLETSERCGGHIHIGTAYFEGNPYAFANLLTIWNECEELFYKMGNQAGDVPREDVLGYAKASHGDLENLSGGRKFSITEMSEFKKIQKSLTNEEEKFRGLNLGHYGEEGKDTIEFRIPNGTLNAETVRENIKLFGSLMRVSKEMALNPEYKKEEFEVLLDRDLTESEKVEGLLNLLFDDEQTKSVYRERWNSVKDEKIFDELTKGQTSTFKRGDYSISSVKDFEKVSTSEEAIEQISEVAQEIKREIQEREPFNNKLIKDDAEAR